MTLVRWALNPNGWCPYKKRRDRHRDDVKTWGEPHGTTETKTRAMHLQAKDCQGRSQADREAQNSLSGTSGENTVLPTPWPRASGLRKCERTHFCCKPPSLWCLASPRQLIQSPCKRTHWLRKQKLISSLSPSDGGCKSAASKATQTPDEKLTANRNYSKVWGQTTASNQPRSIYLLDVATLWVRHGGVQFCFARTTRKRRCADAVSCSRTILEVPIQ